MSYYIGLSFLSNKGDGLKKQSSCEARRILSYFEKREINENDLSKESGGRPYFCGKDADFNISHSANMVAVSYAGKKEIRVGCDIEKIKPRKNIAKIAKDKFSEYENKYLYSSGYFSEINFFKIWTLKESYIKLKGLSVFDMSKIPSFVKENEGTKLLEFALNADVKKPLSFRLYEISNNSSDTNTEKEIYILAEAVEGESPRPEIVWLSSSLNLHCKMIEEIKA